MGGMIEFGADYPGGRIEFGIDYLLVMRMLILAGHKGEADGVDYAVAQLLLVQWGFTADEINQAHSMLSERAGRGALPNDLLPFHRRIAEYTKGDKVAQERLLKDLVAVSSMDRDYTKEEGNYLTSFRDLLDLRPSEFVEVSKRGIAWAEMLIFFGETYSKVRHPK